MSRLDPKYSIRALSGVEPEVIVQCLVRAFDGYFVRLPADVDYWVGRWKGARVDLNGSFGVFQGDDLVAFILIGIDELQGELTAFNVGTGVLPDHRGLSLVDELYEKAIPKWTSMGITRGSLEVICDNSRGIRVYERIGFEIKRKIHCFKGMLTTPDPDALQIALIKDLPIDEPEVQDLYSWENLPSAIRSSPHYNTYSVHSGENYLGHFVMDPNTGYVPRMESPTMQYRLLLSAASKIHREMKMNNVDPLRADLIQALKDSGLENHIDQFEMTLRLS